MQTKHIYENVGIKMIRTHICSLLNFCRAAQDNRNPSDDTVPLLAVEKKKLSSNYFCFAFRKENRVCIAKVSSILTFS